MSRPRDMLSRHFSREIVATIPKMSRRQPSFLELHHPIKAKSRSTREGRSGFSVAVYRHVKCLACREPAAAGCENLDMT